MFDVADTGRTECARSPYLWELREEHKDAVSAMLENRYDVDGASGLADQQRKGQQNGNYIFIMENCLAFIFYPPCVCE